MSICGAAWRAGPKPAIAARPGWASRVRCPADGAGCQCRPLQRTALWAERARRERRRGRCETPMHRGGRGVHPHGCVLKLIHLLVLLRYSYHGTDARGQRGRGIPGPAGAWCDGARCGAGARRCVTGTVDCKGLIEGKLAPRSRCWAQPSHAPASVPCSAAGEGPGRREARAGKRALLSHGCNASDSVNCAATGKAPTLNSAVRWARPGRIPRKAAHLGRTRASQRICA